MCICLLIVVVGQAINLNRPFVNIEYAFSEAARSLADSQYTDGIERYWMAQANPLGYSALASVCVRLFGYDHWTVRVPAVFGMVALLCAGWLYCRRYPGDSDPPGAGQFWLWAALIALNPLVWIYGGSATADVLPAGLIALSLVMCFVADTKMRWHVVAGLLFAATIVMKLNAILLGLGFVYVVWHGKAPIKTKLVQLLNYTLVPALGLVAYFSVVYSQYGVLLVPDAIWNLVKDKDYIADYPAIVLMYLSYLVMLLGLIGIMPIINTFTHGSRRRATVVTLAALVAGIAAWLILSDFGQGELDYGVFSRLLPAKLFTLIRVAGLMVAVFLFVHLFESVRKRTDGFAGVVVFSIVPFLLIWSLYRPTQRYLLLCLPIVLIWLILESPRDTRNWLNRLGWPTAVVFAAITFVGVCYITSLGQAAENMALWIRQNGDVNNTSPGVITQHARHHFPVKRVSRPRYVVVSSTDADVLHEEAVRLFGHNVQTFYLVEVR